MNSVEVRGAFKGYGKKGKRNFVLKNLDMSVQTGSIYCLLGSSGCGKTTLLSSILGMIKLDSGEIKVLGSDKASKVCHRIGYMPQETALVGELTVKETIFYFGNIFQMDSTELNIRFEMLKSLLELPPDDMRVEDCSGGEKRRISFAAACVHEPDLLILDEPTVGLDPLLRDKIWSFLWNVTRTSKLSVIITTHYIAEAQKSDRVGFMRNGALLAEDSPSNILTRYEVDTLDDAFLAMCLKKESPPPIYAAVDTNLDEITKIADPNELETTHEMAKGSKMVRWQIVNELSKKHYRKYMRQPSLFLYTLIMPILLLVMIYCVFSGDFHQVVAFVNDDLEGSASCLRESTASSINDNGDCYVPNASCLFMSRINEQTIEKEFHDSFDDAFSRLIEGKVNAVVYIKKNFSKAFNDYLISGNISDEPAKLAAVHMDVYVDETFILLTRSLQMKIGYAAHMFYRSLFTVCNKSASFLDPPIVYEKPIYGSFKWNSRTDVGHLLIVIYLIFLTSCLTVTPILIERKEGLWNRTLLAGVTFNEMLLAQLITYTFFVVVLSIEFVAFAEIVYETASTQSSVNLFMLLMCLGWCGMFFGIFLSTICPNILAANTAMFAFAITMCAMCGIFYPIDKMREVFQIFSKILPFTYPANAVRNIMMKKYDFSHESVMMGFLVSFAWMVIIVGVSVFTLKRRKFSRNT